MGKKLILLLEVDRTSALDDTFNEKYYYNDALLQVIRGCGVEHQIYLFTIFTVAGVAKNIEEEPVSTPSRLKLTQYLQGKFQINVQGVVTHLDPLYKKGMGKYFQEVIKPFEAYMLAGEDLRRGDHGKDFKEACERELKLTEELVKLKEIGKDMLLTYVVDQLKLKFSEDEFVFVAFDASRFQLEALKNQAKKLDLSLLPVLVKVEFDQQHYTKLFQEFIAKEFPKDLRKQLEQAYDGFAIPTENLTKEGSKKELLSQFDQSQTQRQEPVKTAESNTAATQVTPAEEGSYGCVML